MNGYASGTGYGVVGNASGSATGVAATSETGTGTNGFSVAGTGVQGITTTGSAVEALLFGPSATHLRLTADPANLPAAPPSSSVYRQAGSMVRDANGDLWWCVVGGTPGTWRKLAGPSTSGALHVLPTPVRVYDSRPGQPPTGIGPKTPLAASTPRAIDLKGNSSGVPAGATAVLVNLVATGTTSAFGGFMTIYKNGIAFPGTSNLNWSAPAQTVAVTTITAVDANSLCQVYAGSVTDVVVDVLGYYR